MKQILAEEKQGKPILIARAIDEKLLFFEDIC